MPSTVRQLKALTAYMPSAPVGVFQSLGGTEMLQWAMTVLANNGDDVSTDSLGPDEITILGLPYGGPNNGKDNDGQFFSQMTDFFDGVSDYPPVMYTHGTQNGFDPEPVGRVTKRWYDDNGGWFKVRLDPQSPRYSQLLDAKAENTLYASTGVVPASYSADDRSGHIDTWLVGELSLVDTRDGYQPVNRYAVAKAESVDLKPYYGERGGIVAELVDQLRELLGIKSQPIIEEQVMPPEVVEVVAETKCEACDEAKRLAAEVKAELDTPQVKCARCPEAIQWIRTMVKAGKMPPAEAYTHLVTFTESDESFDTLKAEVEARTIAPVKAEQLFVAGGTSQPDPQSTVDEAWLSKQRRLAGLVSN